MTMTLIPAYGRDFKFAKDAIKSFLEDGQDWIINDFSSHWDGKPVGSADLAGETIKLRFCENRKVCVVNVPHKEG